MNEAVTQSGTVYRFRETEDGTEVSRVGGEEMRRDGEWLKVFFMAPLEVGSRIEMLLEPLGEGTTTVRQTTPVVEIREVNE